MTQSNSFFYSLAQVGNAVGKGILSGLVGTVAITLSQMIEMQLTKRGSSEAPAITGGKALGVEPRGQAELEKQDDAPPSKQDELKQDIEENKDRFTQIMHFSYGTSWGVARSALDLIGVQGPAATFIHFGALWGTALVMLPATKASPPITEWSPTQIGTDIVHHAVYALAAGACYDAMTEAERSHKGWSLFTR